jgi:hypothetical protein
MASISVELLRKDYSEWQKLKSKEPFGRVMNSRYHFEDKELEKELDSNIALLIIMSRHVVKL